MKYLLVLALFLGGCTSAPVRPALHNYDPGTILVSAEDRLACGPLPLPPEGYLSEEETGLLLVSWARLYNACADAKSRLLEVIDGLNAE